jgi:hypothetical protein
MSELKIEVLWRNNLGGQMARRWTRSERNMLLDTAGKMSTLETSEMTGRSRRSVLNKAWTLGFNFTRARLAEGFVSCGAVARLAACDPSHAATVAAKLWPSGPVVHGTGSGRRYYLGRKEARRLMLAIRPGRADWVDRLFEATEEAEDDVPRTYRRRAWGELLSQLRDVKQRIGAKDRR